MKTELKDHNGPGQVVQHYAFGTLKMTNLGKQF